MSFCTSAITGTDHPAHQPIYVCAACVPSSLPDGLPPCVCETCAAAIGEYHDVEFVGVGPSTCDCPVLVEGGLFDDGLAEELRELLARSEEEAARLGRTGPGPLNRPPAEGGGPTEGRPEGGLGGYAFGTFTISGLTDDDCERLVRQATVLVEHSKEVSVVLSCASLSANHSNATPSRELTGRDTGNESVRRHSGCPETGPRTSRSSASWSPSPGGYTASTRGRATRTAAGDASGGSS